MKYLVVCWNWILLLVCVAMAVEGCASDPLAVKTVTKYTGHCAKAELAGQDFTAECSDILTKVDFASGISSYSFELTGDRVVMFISASAPNSENHREDQPSFYIVSMQTGTDRHDYKMPAIVCSTSRELPVPSKIDCVGQAEAAAVLFEFQTEGAPQIHDGP